MHAAESIVIDTSMSATRAWTIRRARAVDAVALSQLAERTFRDAFSEFNTAADMDLHCRYSYTASIQEDEIADPAGVTLVAEPAHSGQSAGGEFSLIAYALLRLDRAPSSGGAPVMHIRRIYVSQPWQGSGLAQGLMRAIVDEAYIQAIEFVQLGVWERNPRAIRFYSNYGFAVTGEHTFLLGTDPQRDLVMSAALATLDNALRNRHRSTKGVA